MLMASSFGEAVGEDSFTTLRHWTHDISVSSGNCCRIASIGLKLSPHSLQVPVNMKKYKIEIMVTITNNHFNLYKSRLILRKI